jgi:hypothetical protein
MADPIAGTNTSRNAVAGLLFITSGMMSVDLMNKFNGSPDEPSDSRYMAHAMGISMFFAAGSSLISKSIWPITGAATVNAYLYWLYGQKAGG